MNVCACKHVGGVEYMGMYMFLFVFLYIQVHKRVHVQAEARGQHGLSSMNDLHLTHLRWGFSVNLDSQLGRLAS